MVLISVREFLKQVHRFQFSNQPKTVIIFRLQRTVYIRVVFLKVGEIDTVKEKYFADVFVQSRWREPNLDHSQV